MSTLKVNAIEPSTGSAVDISATSSDFSGAVNIIGNLTLSADLTINSDTLIVSASGDSVTVNCIRVADDSSEGGVAGHLTLTNVFDTTSTSASGEIDTAKFIKAYNGTTVIWIPYYTDLA